MARVMSQDDIRAQISQRVNGLLKSAPSYQSSLVAQASLAYERKWKKPMDDSKKAVLVNSFNHMEEILSKRGYTREQISSAVADISKTDNPITMLFSLMSIVIPNFAYTEAIGIQPMPTKKSPVYFPQITANEDRNGVKAGDVLLGASNWNQSNNYTSNRAVYDITAATTAAAVSYTAVEGNIVPGSFVATAVIGGATVIITDDGAGAIPEVVGVTTGAGTVDYVTGAVTFTLAAALGAGDSLSVTYRYESASLKPAQVVLEWTDRLIEANPYRLRSTYDLDNFYQAKQVLSGYDIDEVMNTSLAGYINKEISGSVFDDMLAGVDADYAWSATAPQGVAWALHRLSVLETIVAAGNAIRKNIARAGGNVIVAGSDLMNTIETLGSDLWVPVKQTSEPIGPYVAGTLAGRFTVIKNQDYPDAKSVMCYKANDVEASWVGGSFISLYSTPPIALDSLEVVQGLGTQFGYAKAFDNSTASITVTKTP